MAIKHFKYKPKIIQTDNGFEFTHFRKTKRTHPFDIFCANNSIEHKLIRPRTPRHNGKVERSHRNDNERFYSNLIFYSYDDLIIQMKRYLYKSNRLPMQVLGWLSPIEIFTSIYSYLYIILSSIDARSWQPVNTIAASRSAFSLEIYISTP